MKHIVIDARIINSSTGTYCERLLHYLQKLDKTNKYSVLIRSADKDYWKPTNDNFKVVFADFGNYSIDEQFGLNKLLTSLSPDLVHFCMPQQPVFYKGLHVTTFHDLTLLKTYNSDKNWLIYHIKQFIGWFVFKIALKSSKYIITDAQYTKDELIAFSPICRDKTVVAHLAADVIIGKLTPYRTGFKQFLLYVGQQSDYKNIRTLATSHQNLLAQHPNLGLILVGRENANIKANKELFALNNYKNIVFTGFLPDGQRDWLYANAAAYIFPSLYEGFGLPGLEAMGYGAPVISSNTTCLSEIYEDAALYFDPRNIDDMASAINKILTDKKLRDSLIAKGHNQVKKYSWATTAQITHDVYMKALEK